MRIITANEMEHQITEMEKEKEVLFETLEEWCKDKELTTNKFDSLARFMQDTISFVQVCKNKLMEKDMESDIESLQKFWAFLSEETSIQKKQLETYEAKIIDMQALAEEMKKDVTENKWEQLLYAKEMVYLSGMISHYYTFVHAYHCAMMDVYRYLVKIEKRKQIKEK